MRVGCNFKSKAIRTNSNFLENNTMNKKQVLKQIRNLNAKQCKQLEVEEAFEGNGTVEAVMAWLGDSTLYGADGNELDLPAIFAADDPATLSLHSGMPDADEPAAEEMIATEIVASVDAPAIEEAMELQGETQAAIRRGVRDAIRKTQKSALPRTGRIQMTSNRKCSKQFASAEDQHIASQWLGAKIFNVSSAKNWWKNYAPSGLKAQGELVATEGGNLVPSPLGDAILAVWAEHGLTPKVCRNFPMTSDTLDIPSLTSGATTTVVAENVAIAESSAVWGNVALVAKKRACLMKWGSEVGNDALWSMSDILSDYMGRSIAEKMDAEFIAGDGSAGAGLVVGLKSATSGSQVLTTSASSTWSGITLAELVETSGNLADKFMRNASWIMSRQFYSQVVLRVLAATGGNTIDTLGVGSTGTQFLGFPIWFSDQCQTATSSGDRVCYFGDWENAAVFGNRQSIEVATSEHVNFAEDQINIRATARWDIDVHDDTAFTALITA